MGTGFSHRHCFYHRYQSCRHLAPSQSLKLRPVGPSQDVCGLHIYHLRPKKRKRERRASNSSSSPKSCLQDHLTGDRLHAHFCQNRQSIFTVVNRTPVIIESSVQGQHIIGGYRELPLDHCLCEERLSWRRHLRSGLNSSESTVTVTGPVMLGADLDFAPLCAPNLVTFALVAV
jgi:hypothetical protein